MTPVLRRFSDTITIECTDALEAEHIARDLLDVLAAVADDLPSHEVRVEQSERRVFITGNLNHAEDAVHVMMDVHDDTCPNIIFAETGVADYEVSL
jgi:hypothetical protein